MGLIWFFFSTLGQYSEDVNCILLHDTHYTLYHETEIFLSLLLLYNIKLWCQIILLSNSEQWITIEKLNNQADTEKEAILNADQVFHWCACVLSRYMH